MPVLGILALIAASILLAYFAVGAAVRYHRGLRRCPEVLPNYQFWRRFCSCLLSVLTCGKCGSSGRGSEGRASEITVLPMRPDFPNEMQFETLGSEGDNDDVGFGVQRGLQPGEVVVRY